MDDFKYPKAIPLLSTYREDEDLNDHSRDYGLNDGGSIPSMGREFFSSAQRSDRL